MIMESGFKSRQEEIKNEKKTKKGERKYKVSVGGRIHRVKYYSSSSYKSSKIISTTGLEMSHALSLKYYIFLFLSQSGRELSSCDGDCMSGTAESIYSLTFHRKRIYRILARIPKRPYSIVRLSIGLPVFLLPYCDVFADLSSPDELNASQGQESYLLLLCPEPNKESDS